MSIFHTPLQAPDEAASAVELTESLLLSVDGSCGVDDIREYVLFALGEDPNERTNLVDDPDYASAVSAFRDRVAELGYGPDADPAYREAGYS